VSEEKNIKTYTATDIEKYWKGKLGIAEMHAIEKAAMDDPLLADALEGYKNTSNVADDIDTLHDRLDKRVLAAVPVIAIKEKKLPWLKVAAAVIVISGLALLVQQLVLNKKESSIANVENADKNKADVATNIEQQRPDTAKTITGNLSDTLSFKASEKKSENLNPQTGNFALSVNDTTKNIDDRLAGDIKKENLETQQAVKSAPAIVTPEKREELSRDKKAFGRGALDSNKSLKEANVNAVAQVKEAETFYDRNTNAAAFLNNRYNYRVVDVQNNPVPFANVMNTRDNVGTYTDIRGNFNLLSSDSVLNVQIRSLGYLSDNYKIVPSNQTPTLVLKEDNNARRQFQAPNQNMVSNVTRKDTAELEEPEVGWGNYNTYVANNIQIPDNIRKKSTLSNVELSFDIDKAGQPVNIKVTKSSQCKECDEEAIRLLKEGPKWKRKGKKSKTTISIAVDQK